MSSATIRAAIAAKIATVPDIGKVHAFERYATRQNDFRDLYTTGGKLLGWFVQWKGAEERPRATDHNTEILRWEITGFMALEDGEQSEIAFGSLIDQLRTAFRNDETLGGAVETIEVDNRFGLQVDGIEPVNFSGVLCHRARLSLVTESTVDFADPEDVKDFVTGNTKWDLAPPDEAIDEEDTVTLETE
jgi:hypothetical protein